MRRLAAIVESSSDAIYTFQLDGAVLSWNNGAERTFGYEAAEIAGRSVVMLSQRRPDAAQVHEFFAALERGRDRRARGGGAAQGRRGHQPRLHGVPDPRRPRRDPGGRHDRRAT